MFDLAPAADEMSRLVAGVRDDQLEGATPCPDWTVADLLRHVIELSWAFATNARKAELRPEDSPVSEDRLPADWRTALPAQLDALTAAWRDPEAWQGRVSAGGVEMAAGDNAVVGVEELVVHGWDLARATGQRLRVEDADLDRLDRFMELFVDPDGSGNGPYGPPVEAPADATRLDRLLARAGRDPGWSATR